MGLRERHKAFQERFTPKRRMRAGGALLVIWAVGICVYPGQILDLRNDPGNHVAHERLAARVAR